MATKQFSGIYGIKPWWQRRLAGVERELLRRQVHPDIITLAGVACAGLLGLTLALSGTWGWLALLVAPFAIGRLAANALDGLVARKSGLARPWGEVFNEVSDRVADAAVFVGLALNPAVYAPLAWGALTLTLLNSYLGTAAKAAGGQRQFGGLLAKADRMIYLALFSPIALIWGASAWNWLLAAFTPAILITLVQRYRWIYREFMNR
jgi:CDP-diacylglycerol---glycerol-3-phosphate 3-phosphatidyltransferase